MPSIRDFEKNKVKKAQMKSGKNKSFHKNSVEKSKSTPSSPSKGDSMAKRRPGRETVHHSDRETVQQADIQQAVLETVQTATAQTKIKTTVNEGVEYVEVPMVENQEPSSSDPEAKQEASASDAHEKIEISFFGSETLRAKFPKPFELAEDVATQWVHDGDFDNLPVGNPLAQLLLGRGLKKAKQVEKQIMASPKTEQVILKALQAGIKAQSIVNEIKTRAETLLNPKKSTDKD
jgi:hypothetical protein